MATQQRFVYPNPAVSLVIDAVGPNGDPIPLSSILIAGEDPSGDLIPIAVDANGEVQVDISSMPLPPGAATAAKQDIGNASLSSIDGKIVTVDTGAVVVASSALPTGAATAAAQGTGNTSLSSIDGKTPALVGGRVPVDVSSLPLPSGAATEATLSSLNGKVTAVNTGAVVVASSALPTGAATEATLSTLNGKVPSNLTVTSTRLLVDGSGVTQPVSGTVTVGASTGRAKANAPARNSYSSVNVTTGAWVQLIASTTSTANLVEVFDSSGQTMELGVGAAASEVTQFYITPGGNGQVPLAIPSGSRVSIRAVSGTASSGEIVLNLYT